MGTPAFGVELHQYLDAPAVLREAQQAEALGYASVWLADSRLVWRELWVLLGAVAATTRRVALGTGVTKRSYALHGGSLLPPRPPPLISAPSPPKPPVRAPAAGLSRAVTPRFQR